MKKEYLGDSYDAVKRLWRDLLQDWAPLFADGRFIPEDIREHFSLFTKIPILKELPQESFSVLNDPDTGIRLPGEINQKEGRTHISITTIVDQLKINKINCVVTFDQSYHRKGKGSHKDQRITKMDEIREKGFYSFYYVSHAPFLFACPSKTLLIELKNLLKEAGVPEFRIEKR